MKPRRITVLTSGPLCRNPRSLKEARLLGDAGHQVTVVTIARQASLEAADRHLLEDAPFRKVALDRTGSSFRSRLVSFLERGSSRLARSCGLRNPAALGPFLALRRKALSLPCDLLIAHSELPLCVAADLLDRGLNVGVDLEDWHSRDLLPAARRHRPIRLLERTESIVLRRASFSTTTSHAMAAALAGHYGAPLPEVVANTFPLSKPPPERRRGNIPAFVWISQTIGPGRGLEQFIAGWARTVQRSRCVLVGNAQETFVEGLLAGLSRHKREDVSIRPLVAPGEIPALLSSHEIGLALEPGEPANKDLTISNKLFHYLDAGLAVLATPTAGQREVFSRDPSIGLLDDLSDPRVLAERIDAWLSSPDAVAAAGRSARRLAEREFNWNITSRGLLRTVEASLTTGS